MSKTLKQKLVAYALVLPAFLVVMLTVAYPIVSAVIQSFQDEKTGAFTLDNYAYFFTEPAQRMNIFNPCPRDLAEDGIAVVVEQHHTQLLQAAEVARLSAVVEDFRTEPAHIWLLARKAKLEHAVVLALFHRTHLHGEKTLKRSAVLFLFH